MDLHRWCQSATDLHRWCQSATDLVTGWKSAKSTESKGRLISPGQILIAMITKMQVFFLNVPQSGIVPQYPGY